MREIKTSMQTVVCILILLFSLPQTMLAQRGIYESGGTLSQEQAAYDVKYYDLELEINPDERFIQGQLLVEADIVHPTHFLVMDLDTLLEVSRIEELFSNFDKQRRSFERQGGLIWIDLGITRQAGATVSLRLSYEGHPRVAPRAPWDGGFSWAKTSTGAHWIATTCQQIGADVWWPCKDHVSDEPDSMSLHIKVPAPLVVASNGQLRSVERNADNSNTYHWFISNPINIYNVALNIAPYRIIEEPFESVDGSSFPVIFYVLPEDFEKGQKLFPEILDHLGFFEEFFGPYPFRADKYGVAQTPHLGMEHQSIIAYGANFDNGSMTGGKDWGFDALHHHELAHEWWGNLVTNTSWEDMWLHEGFASYMQALYSEQLDGKTAYKEKMISMRRFSNLLAIAPRQTLNSKEIYRAPIYTKGAWVLHNLRYLIGDLAFFKALRLMAYPDKRLEKITDGQQCRFATTEDFQGIVESVSGSNLGWFFEVYLRQAKLPKLEVREETDHLFLKWESPLSEAFPMPVEIRIEEELKKLDIPEEGLQVPWQPGSKYQVDPELWLLYEAKK